MKFKPYSFSRVLLWGVMATTCLNIAPLFAAAPTDYVSDAYRVARITGRLVDETGEGIPGATIKVKGSNTGTVTDVNGNFTIDAPENAILVCTYTGYESQEINVGSRTSGIVVAMVQAANTLSDVVVIGYGSVKRSDLTAAVSSIKSTDLKATPVTSVDQALSGRASGVVVTQASGAPGGAVTVRVRGANSLQSGSEPLYVIDGMPIYSDNDGNSVGGNRVASNALASLNPSDIESVEILKDASGTAIYGSRGSNGVVLITTKRGKAGATKVDYEGSQGIQTVTNTIEMMNGTEYAEYQNLRAISRGQSAPYANPSSYGTGINWLDETTRTGNVANHQLTFSGGNEKMTFSLMPGYFKNNGIIQNTNFERFSLRANIDGRFLNDRIRLGTSSMIARTSTNAIPTDRGGPGGAIITILGQNPIGPVYKADGTYDLFAYDGRFLTNPVAEVNEVTDNDKALRYLGNTYLLVELMKGLTFKTSAGFDLLASNRETFYSSLTRLGRERGRSYELANRNRVNFLNENVLNYTKEMSNSRLDVVAGYSYQTDNNRFYSAQTNSFTFQDLNINRIENGVTILAPASSRQEWVLKSFIGRVNYSLMDKYLVTVNFRRDGSSRFGPNNQWANFPSVAFAWRVKQESFLKNVDFFSDMKVRLSWGITGNSEIPVGRSSAELSGNKNYLINGGTAAGVAETRLGNKDLKWESTRMLNFGLDFGIMDGRINFNVDYFNNTTKDLLLFVPLGPSTGFTSALKNNGELNNRGLEIAANIAAINKSNFRWDIGLNASFLKNEVTSLEGAPPFYSYTISHLGPEGSYVAEGLPIGGWYGFKSIGIWQSQEEINANPSLAGIDKPGYVRYEDINGDGTITNADRVSLGDPNPKFIWGLNSSFDFGAIDFSFFLRGSHGQEIRNLQASEHADGVGNYNQYRSVYTDSWSETNKGGTRPVIDATREFPSYFRRSSFFIEDGSFVRLQNVTLGYNIPKIKGVRSLRVYVSGQNLMLFTKYTGWDPEVSNGGQSPLNRGDDYDAYPRAKTYNIGVQLGL